MVPQGKVGDRLGFFPANFVQRVRPGESVWRSCRAVQGDKERGHISLRENQVGGPCQWWHLAALGCTELGLLLAAPCPLCLSVLDLRWCGQDTGARPGDKWQEEGAGPR